MKGQPARLGQLGTLLTAMVAVVLSGRCDLTESPDIASPLKLGQRGPKRGRITLQVRKHLSPRLLDHAGVEYAIDDELPGGRPNVRVALRLLQVLPKWQNLVPVEDRERWQIDTLRLLNGKGGAR